MRWCSRWMQQTLGCGAGVEGGGDSGERKAEDGSGGADDSRMLWVGDARYAFAVVASEACRARGWRLGCMRRRWSGRDVVIGAGRALGRVW